MNARKRMAVRTIRHGRVKIGGKWFMPNEHHMKYDGRLDGMRYAFGRYWTSGKPLPFVSMWGTEACYKGIHDNPDWEDTEYDDPSHITQDDGSVVCAWVWWDEVTA